MWLWLSQEGTCLQAQHLKNKVPQCLQVQAPLQFVCCCFQCLWSLLLYLSNAHSCWGKVTPGGGTQPSLPACPILLSSEHPS